MSSLSVGAAVSVYAKFSGKPVADLTVEDLIKGIVVGRAQEGDTVDRVLCYRSAFDDADIQLNYCRGDAASIAVLGSRNTKEARVVFKDGAFTDGKLNPNHGIPQYLRDAFQRAVTSL